jgi:hypothetical protein
MPVTPIETPPATAPVPEDRRRELLERFGLLAEEDLALLWGVRVKTLKNKPLADLPRHVVMGRQRFFYVDSVRQMMHAHAKTPPFQRRKIRAVRAAD